MEMIRNYIESDWEKVKQIYDLSKPDEMKGIVDPNEVVSLDKDEKMLQYFKESTIWVYEKEYQLAGFIGLKRNVISWLFVHPDNRRQGIARNLLTRLINECNHPLTLNIVKSNRAAMSLYLKMGFNVSAEFDGEMYGQKIQAVRMIRNISAEPVVSTDRYRAR